LLLCSFFVHFVHGSTKILGPAIGDLVAIYSFIFAASLRYLYSLSNPEYRIEGYNVYCSYEEIESKEKTEKLIIIEIDNINSKFLIEGTYVNIAIYESWFHPHSFTSVVVDNHKLYFFIKCSAFQNSWTGKFLENIKQAKPIQLYLQGPYFGPGVNFISGLKNFKEDIYVVLVSIGTGISLTLSVLHYLLYNSDNFPNVRNISFLFCTDFPYLIKKTQEVLNIKKEKLQLDVVLRTKITNPNFTGIEIEKKYFDTEFIMERIKKFDAKECWIIYCGGQNEFNIKEKSIPIKMRLYSETI